MATELKADRPGRRISIVAGILGCNQSTVHRMLDDGRLEGYRIGGYRYVFNDAISKYQRDNAE